MGLKMVINTNKRRMSSKRVIDNTKRKVKARASSKRVIDNTNNRKFRTSSKRKVRESLTTNNSLVNNNNPMEKRFKMIEIIVK